MASLSFPETFFALLCAIVFVIAISVLSTIMLQPLIKQREPHKAQKDQPILSGRVTLVYKEERCARIVEDGEEYTPSKGETLRPLSLQDHGFPLDPHYFYTSDHARIRVVAYAVWSICDVRNLLRSASLSDDSLRATVQMAVLPALTNAVAGFKLADITGKMSEIAGMAQKDADAWLKRYGLALHRISITHIQLPDPPQSSKPDGHKEAERLTTLDGIVPKVDEKTLNYAHRMRELELAQTKESRSEKKS